MPPQGVFFEKKTCKDSKRAGITTSFESESPITVVEVCRGSPRKNHKWGRRCGWACAGIILIVVFLLRLCSLSKPNSKKKKAHWQSSLNLHICVCRGLSIDNTPLVRESSGAWFFDIHKHDKKPWAKQNQSCSNLKACLPPTDLVHWIGKTTAQEVYVRVCAIYSPYNPRLPVLKAAVAFQAPVNKAPANWQNSLNLKNDNAYVLRHESESACTFCIATAMAPKVRQGIKTSCMDVCYFLWFFFFTFFWGCGLSWRLWQGIFKNFVSLKWRFHALPRKKQIIDFCVQNSAGTRMVAARSDDRPLGSPSVVSKI